MSKTKQKSIILDDREFSFVEGTYGDYCRITGLIENTNLRCKVNTTPKLLDKFNLTLEELRGATIQISAKEYIQGSEYVYKYVEDFKITAGASTEKYFSDVELILDQPINLYKVRGGTSNPEIKLFNENLLFTAKAADLLDCFEEAPRQDLLAAGSKFKFREIVSDRKYRITSHWFQAAEFEDLSGLVEVTYNLEDLYEDSYWSSFYKDVSDTFDIEENAKDVFHLKFDYQVFAYEFQNQLGYLYPGLQSCIKLYELKKKQARKKGTVLDIDFPAVKIKGYINPYFTRYYPDRDDSGVYYGKPRHFITHVHLEPIGFDVREWPGYDFKLPRTRREFLALFRNRTVDLNYLRQQESLFNLKILNERIIKGVEWLQDNVDPKPTMLKDGILMFVRHFENVDYPLVITQRLGRSAITNLWLNDPDIVSSVIDYYERELDMRKAANENNILHSIPHRSHKAFVETIKWYVDVLDGKDAHYFEEFNRLIEIWDSMGTESWSESYELAQTDVCEENYYTALASAWVFRKLAEYRDLYLKSSINLLRMEAIRGEFAVEDTRFDLLRDMMLKDRSKKVKQYLLVETLKRFDEIPEADRDALYNLENREVAKPFIVLALDNNMLDFTKAITLYDGSDDVHVKFKIVSTFNPHLLDPIDRDLLKQAVESLLTEITDAEHQQTVNVLNNILHVIHQIENPEIGTTPVILHYEQRESYNVSPNVNFLDDEKVEGELGTFRCVACTTPGTLTEDTKSCEICKFQYCDDCHPFFSTKNCASTVLNGNLHIYDSADI